MGRGRAARRHVWNTVHFVPHSFDFSYNPSEWRRALRFASGDATAARDRSVARARADPAPPGPAAAGGRPAAAT